MKQIPTKTLQFCVYKITNNISGKSYIGKTCGLEVRVKAHLNGSKDLEATTKFPRAIRKYSEDSWDISILYETDDENHSYEVEALLVDEYDTFKSGYNSSIGGIGVGSGENHPMYKKTHSKESKKKQSIAQIGKKRSKESKKKQSISVSGINNPMFGKKGINNPNFGKRWKHSKESKKNQSIIKLGENNPMFGTLPWNTGPCKSNGLDINWFYLDKVYKLRIQNPSYYGPARIYKILVKDYPNIKKSPTSFQGMFKWIEKNGNPTQNKDWLDFHDIFLK